MSQQMQDAKGQHAQAAYQQHQPLHNGLSWRFWWLRSFFCVRCSLRRTQPCDASLQRASLRFGHPQDLLVQIWIMRLRRACPPCGPDQRPWSTVAGTEALTSRLDDVQCSAAACVHERQRVLIRRMGQRGRHQFLRHDPILSCNKEQLQTLKQRATRTSTVAM